MRRGLQWYREPPDEELGRIVSALNTPSDPAKERLMKALGLDTPSTAGVAPLRLYVEAWVQSGPNSRIFAKRHPKLWAYFTEPWQTLEEKPFLLASECDMAEIERTWATAPSSEQEALKYFVSLITNPLWERLGGPCKRCGKYFVRHTHTARVPKVYCSRSCGTKSTAVVATKKAREVEHSQKLRRATEARTRGRRQGHILDADNKALAALGNTEAPYNLQ